MSGAIKAGSRVPLLFKICFVGCTLLVTWSFFCSLTEQVLSGLEIEVTVDSMWPDGFDSRAGIYSQKEWQ